MNATSPTQADKPRHIAWREVIELPPEVLARLEPAHQQKLLEALDAIEKDPFGQSKLARMAKLQHELPDSTRWQMPIPDASQMDPQALKTAMALNADRAKRDPKRLYLNVGHTGDPEIQVHTRDGSLLYRQMNDDHYHAGTHSVKMFFPAALNRQVVKVLPSGEHKLVLAPLDEALVHEFQHAIDYLEMRLGYTAYMHRSCREASASIAQSDYATSRDPNAPRREMYQDAEFRLKELIVTNYPSRAPIFEKLRKAHIPASISGMVYPSEPQVLEKATALAAPLLALDQRCGPPLSDEALLERTRALLHSQGLATKDISDAQMQRWISDGMRRHGVQDNGR